MSEELKCPICGEPQVNKRSLALHMWNHHKIKYSEYMKGNNELNESKNVAKDGLIKPSIVKENKEFVNETPAMKIDKDIIKESEKPDRDFVKTIKNPYRDLYPTDGLVMNEWLN